MKKILFLFLISIILNNVYAQKRTQLQLLDKFFLAHNLGTEKAIAKFIEETYKPILLKKINMEKHIAFYQHIIKEFGPLNNEIYEVVESRPTKLIVNLIKKGQNITNKSIDPTEILMVKIDTDKSSLHI